MFLLGQFSCRAALIDVTVTDSPDPVTISNTLTFTINLTNTSGLTLTNLLVTNALPASAQLLSATTTTGIVAQVSGTNAVFLTVRFLTNNGRVTFAVLSRPGALGSITNSVYIAATNGTVPLTNLLTTTEVVLGFANLSVGFVGPSQTVLTNDQMTYTVSVTNHGPNTASGVVLSNHFALGARLIYISPTNLTGSQSGTNLVLNLGSFTSNGVQQIQMVLSPTNAGSFTFASTVFAPSFQDTNTTDNVFTNAVLVTNALPGVITQISTLASSTVDRQSGLMIQRVTFRNTGATSVASLRVNVAGLITRFTGIPDRLYNATGTNSGIPYVEFPVSLAPNATVECVLEFFFPTRTPFNALTITALEVPVISTSSSGATGVAASSSILLGSGQILIEFSAVEGRRYRVLYSDAAAFTNFWAAQPTVVAPGDRVQWIDSGPPKTISAPASVASRFYKVLEVP